MFKRWHVYFCSYISDVPEGKARGNFTISRRGTLSRISEILELQREVANKLPLNTNLVILSLTLLKKTWFKPEV